MPLLVFEFLGTTELLVIALVALIIFGPRKLPEIGRTIGKGMAEFKRASEDFKRTWEYEVEVESRQAEAGPRLPEEGAPAEASPGGDWTAGTEPEAVAAEPGGGTVARGSSAGGAETTPDASDAAEVQRPERERV
jgi:TatA/E family protein of Tat protein translocase